MLWTPEQDMRLKTLWLANNSATECAKLLTREWGEPLTRNAVIGRVTRIKGMPKRAKKQKPDKPQDIRFRKPYVRKAPTTTPQVAPLVSRPHASLPRPKPLLTAPKPTGLITVATLESHHCKWPIGDPRNPAFHFCGSTRHGNKPYCEYHFKLGTEPSRGRG